MIISKTVMVKWNGFTRKWYEEKGYVWTKQHDLFECKIEDLPPGSTTKVLVDCDYKKDGCKGVHKKPYRQVVEDDKNGYGNCCTNKKCGAAKTKEVCMNTYGVDNIQKVEVYKVKSRKKRQKPFSLIVECANSKNLILLTSENEYMNKKSRIRYICPKHEEFGEQSTMAEVFLKNKGCCLYGKGELCGDLNKIDGEIVFNTFVKRGVIPKFKFEDYKKNNQMLPFICPDHIQHGIQYRNYATLLSSQHKCNYCAQEFTNNVLRKNKDDILNYFKSRNLILLDVNEYKNKDSQISFKCPMHLEYIQNISFSGLKNTVQPCDFCRMEESLSKLNQRLRSCITEWKKLSEKECNYRCIFTNSKKYEVHHLKPFNEIIKEALTDLNIDIKDKYTSSEIINIKNEVMELHNKYPLGICMSKKLHIFFHKIYSKNCSMEDFYDFERKIKLGEFNKILENIG